MLNKIKPQRKQSKHRVQQRVLSLRPSVFPLLSSVVILLFIITPKVFSQNWFNDTTSSIRMIARPLPDSIILRWAPADYLTWDLGNRYGYKVLRYTLVRDDAMLPKSELKIMTPEPLKPLAMENWKSLVGKNKYAAITAQAFFGKTFEMQTGGINPEMLRNKANEQQQRFGFALYSADLSPEVAAASGLMLTDRDARKNEKYLYRVFIDLPKDFKAHRDTAYLFTGIADYAPLPRPIELKAEFGDRQVVLNWNSFVYNTTFIAYNIERSSDNKTFDRVNKEPIIQIATSQAQNPELMYAADSFPENDKVYYYRIQGITSFGEMSPWSDVVSGKGVVSISGSPDIVKREIVKGKVKLTWDFPENAEKEITGFRVLRSDNDKVGFISITPKNLKPDVREYLDKSPLPTAYYKIEAFRDSTANRLSFPTLVQLTDSIPPAKPKGLAGKADTSGVVRISWLPNTDADIYGYRVFRSASGKDEFSQLTVRPLSDTFFVDTLSKKDLNAEVFYKIVANDQRQNQSAFSDILKITKPDIITPAAPVIKSISSDEEGITLQWFSSSSPDVQKYILLRQSEGDTSWLKIAEVLHKKKESEGSYQDKLAGNDTVRKYKILAVDFSGNQSEPAISIPSKGFKPMIMPGLKKIDVFVDNEKGRVLLKWKRPEGNIKSYIVYRKTKEKNYSMYDTLPGDALQFEDHGLRAGDELAYRIKIIFTDGTVSGFSDEIVVKY